MFDAVQGVQFGYILCGVIWAMALGLAVGNYACSLIYRLPRKLPILDKTPYCGTCGTLLQPRDLFPVLSALSLGHRCRYCHTPYPKVHTVTELLTALLFILLYLQVGFSGRYLLLAVIGVFWLVVAAIEVGERKVLPVLLVVLAVSGAMLRLMLDGSFFPMFEAGLYALLATALLGRKWVEKRGHIYHMPDAAWLITIAALSVGKAGLVLLVPVAAGLLALTFVLAKMLKKPFAWSPALGLAAQWVLIQP